MEEDFLRIVGKELSKHLESPVSVGIGSSGYGFSIKKTGTLIFFSIDELLQHETPEAAAEELINNLDDIFS
jgi:hypothetical protein